MQNKRLDDEEKRQVWQVSNYMVKRKRKRGKRRGKRGGGRGKKSVPVALLCLRETPSSGLLMFISSWIKQIKDRIEAPMYRLKLFRQLAHLYCLAALTIHPSSRWDHQRWRRTNGTASDGRCLDERVTEALYTTRSTDGLLRNQRRVYTRLTRLLPTSHDYSVRFQLQVSK